MEGALGPPLPKARELITPEHARPRPQPCCRPGSCGPDPGPAPFSGVPAPGVPADPALASIPHAADALSCAGPLQGRKEATEGALGPPLPKARELISPEHARSRPQPCRRPGSCGPDPGPAPFSTLPKSTLPKSTRRPAYTRPFFATPFTPPASLGENFIPAPRPENPHHVWNHVGARRHTTRAPPFQANARLQASSASPSLHASSLGGKGGNPHHVLSERGGEAALDPSTANRGLLRPPRPKRDFGPLWPQQGQQKPAPRSRGGEAVPTRAPPTEAS